MEIIDSKHRLLITRVALMLIRHTQGQIPQPKATHTCALPGFSPNIQILESTHNFAYMSYIIVYIIHKLYTRNVYTIH